MDWRKRTAAGLVAAASLVQAPAALADDFNLVTARSYVSLGSFLNSSALKIRVNDPVATDPVDPGFENPWFDWSESFGNPNVARFRLDGVWRISNRHHLRAMWTDYSLSREVALQRDVSWGDDIIEVGTRARGSHGFSIVELAYEFAFLRGENLELALTAGLHHTSFLARLTTEVSTPEGDLGATVGGKASVNVPLPVLGGHALWRIGGDLYLDGLAQWFALSINEYDGNLVNLRGALTWQPHQWLGIGVGYDYFQTDLDVKKRDFRGSIDWSYSGPQVFLNVGF